MPHSLYDPMQAALPKTPGAVIDIYEARHERVDEPVRATLKHGDVWISEKPFGGMVWLISLNIDDWRPVGMSAEDFAGFIKPYQLEEEW